ncbi:hypothetical protein [Tsuneonella troitsensis]|uniref:hypothetical protein n=1 Tax=Tsuneonella troitsensis TaxID=292222 RepID=UPI0007106B7A|nr:hypothetical protein [Tsuneonella troitsensis]
MATHRSEAIEATQFSLRSFAERYLAEGEEWTEYLRVQVAGPPKSRTTLDEGFPVTTVDEPSPEYSLKLHLHDLLVSRFKAELQSGEWEILALSQRSTDRSRVDLEFAAGIRDVSFLDNRLGGLTLVQIRPNSSDDRYLATKDFIETVCAIIPAKKGVTKRHIQDLADKLLPFSVRDDHFKIAWDNASKSSAWMKPGP